MSGTWRDIAKPIIREVLKENAGKSEKEIRKALKEAYPWGVRQYHPYKIWLDEIRVQLGTKQRKRFMVPENQGGLFNG
jgi:hypothetical protein